jgi:4-hydroxybenzoyl-CoA thioesterase/acyl-CoA thioester hydrolase
LANEFGVTPTSPSFQTPSPQAPSLQAPSLQAPSLQTLGCEASVFQTQRRVEFRDTDAAGIVHFSAFFVYMEQAEHELLRSLGLSVAVRDEEGEIGWPRIAASCEFLHPARFEEILDVKVAIARLGRKSVTYDFRFARGEIPVAHGTMTSVCCRIRPGQPPEAIEIPAGFAQKLRSLGRVDEAVFVV